MFELARSGNGSAVQEILVNSRHIGVELEGFLNTLLGKWECSRHLNAVVARLNGL